MRCLWAAVAAAAMLLSGCDSRTRRAHGDPAQPAFYTTDVDPIFRQHCYGCHAGKNRRGGMNVESREALLRGGKHGPALLPGDPAGSLLIRLIRHEGPANHPMPMPPRDKLTDEDIRDLELWVKAGAPTPGVPAKP